MSSSLDTIRYHSGIAGEEVAEMVDSLEREVSSLREQVEKLMKERDEWKNDAINGGNAGYLREQLAALAEQNEKLREALTSTLDMVARGVPDLETVVTSRKTLSFPDLASPMLNRIKAEVYREAAMHCSKHGSRTADEVSEDLFANADELEQSK